MSWVPEKRFNPKGNGIRQIIQRLDKIRTVAHPMGTANVNRVARTDPQSGTWVEFATDFYPYNALGEPFIGQFLPCFDTLPSSTDSTPFEYIYSAISPKLTTKFY
jgi:hypothetical protein